MFQRSRRFNRSPGLQASCTAARLQVLRGHYLRRQYHFTIFTALIACISRTIAAAAAVIAAITATSSCSSPYNILRCIAADAGSIYKRTTSTTTKMIALERVLVENSSQLVVNSTSNSSKVLLAQFVFFSFIIFVVLSCCRDSGKSAVTKSSA